MTRAFAILLLLIGVVARAQDVRPAYLELQELGDGAVRIIWKRTAAATLTPKLSTGWTDALPTSQIREGDAIVSTWQQANARLAGTTVTIEGLDVSITDALVRVVYANGTELTRLLRPADASFTIPAAARAGAPVRDYLWLGIVHIWTGIDHLLYVLGLVLLVRSLGTLVKTITGFTLAHSITLATATLGYVRVPSAPVEATIALSIQYVALELLRVRAGRRSLAQRAPWSIAMAIGLLHGFGFAGALSEVGLPAHAIPQALLCFNVGIEIGQLAFVALLLCFARVSSNIAPQVAWRQYWLPPYAMGSLASFWVIDRMLLML